MDMNLHQETEKISDAPPLWCIAFFYTVPVTVRVVMPGVAIHTPVTAS